MKVVLSHEAESDLESIADHIARSSPRLAATFVCELRESCLGLSRHPQRFQVVGRFAGIGLRRRVHGNYLIFYRVGGQRIEIVRILHGAMDYEGILFPDV